MKMASRYATITASFKMKLKLPILSWASLIFLITNFLLPAWAHKNEYSPGAIYHLKQGSQLLHEGKPRLARHEFEQALAVEKICPEAHNKIGVCFRREGMLGRAEESFRQALIQQHDYMPSLHNLGTIMYLQERYDDAANLYERALALVDGKDAEIHTNLGNVKRDKGDYGKAIEHYRISIRLQPDYAPAYNNMGLLLYRLKQYQRAAQEISKAIALKNNYSEAFYNLGLVYKAEGKIAEARTSFQKSLKYETNPDYANDTKQLIEELTQLTSANKHLAQGLKFLQLNRSPQAENEFRQAISNHEGSSAIAFNNLGVALANQGKLSQAIEAYRQAISFCPAGFSEAQYNLGQALWAVKDQSGAESAFRQAIQDNHGSHALAHNMLGILFKERGDFQAAIKSYRLAILQSGDTLPVVHYNLAMALERMDSTREAAIEYKLYLASAPNGVNRNKAKQRLSRLGIDVQ